MVKGAYNTIKKGSLNENTVNCSEMCSKCKKLSHERKVLHETWTIFRGDISKRISKNFIMDSTAKFPDIRIGNSMTCT